MVEMWDQTSLGSHGNHQQWTGLWCFGVCLPPSPTSVSQQSRSLHTHTQTHYIFVNTVYQLSIRTVLTQQVRVQGQYWSQVRGGLGDDELNQTCVEARKSEEGPSHHPAHGVTHEHHMVWRVLQVLEGQIGEKKWETLGQKHGRHQQKVCWMLTCSLHTEHHGWSILIECWVGLCLTDCLWPCTTSGWLWCSRGGSASVAVNFLRTRPPAPRWSPPWTRWSGRCPPWFQLSSEPQSPGTELQQNDKRILIIMNNNNNN